jgi:hypothetical protein
MKIHRGPTETGFETLFDTVIAGVYDPEIGEEPELVERLLPLLRPLLHNDDGPLGSELGPEYSIAYALVWFSQFVFQRGIYDPVGIAYRRSLEPPRKNRE